MSAIVSIAAATAIAQNASPSPGHVGFRTDNPNFSTCPYVFFPVMLRLIFGAAMLAGISARTQHKYFDNRMSFIFFV